MSLYDFEGKQPKIDNTTWNAPIAELIGDLRIGPVCYIGWKAVSRTAHAGMDIAEGIAVEVGVLIHVMAAGINGN
jgi:phenylacetic acid degradation protein